MTAADIIRLEVAASADAGPVVRMVLGGVAARVGFSLEELEDLALAVGELFAAAARAGEGPRYELVMEVADSSVTVTTGPFRTTTLRDELANPPAPGAFSARTVMDTVVGSVVVCAAGEDCYAIAFSKHHRVH